MLCPNRIDEGVCQIFPVASSPFSWSFLQTLVTMISGDPGTPIVCWKWLRVSLPVQFYTYGLQFKHIPTMSWQATIGWNVCIRWASYPSMSLVAGELEESLDGGGIERWWTGPASARSDPTICVLIICLLYKLPPPEIHLRNSLACSLSITRHH